ncbi:cytochrome P450 [Asaia krungthepensis]|uniref:Cytochrome P450 n=1 Tax=Asaia krungthepensis NRIC 0535 TaxID=1307925 RepID=A0ABQ0Q5S1_9PROT|nr:cytochrome P450 [Asaia krungthepensis]GBQ92718.1 cytochrome P450 [Asaia krungthepensis NRIC 0535]
MSSSLRQTLSSLPSQIRAVSATLRNPIEALPPSVFHDRIVERHLGRQHIVYVCAPDLVREALVTHSAALDKGEGLRRAIGPGLGNGLLTAEGADWKWQRQALAPVFRASGTDAFLPAMVRATEHCVEELARQGGIVAIEQAMMRLTGRIIIETMLSSPDAVDADAMAEGLGVFLEQTRWSLLGDLLGTPEWLPHPGKAKGLAAARALRAQALAQIRARRALNVDDGPDDLLNRLLTARDPDTGRVMSDEEIIDNLLTFLTAGHETTALALAWTFDRLSRHPEIMRGVQRELDSILPGKESALDASTLNQLDLTRRVLRESMRLTPPAPIIIREVRTPFELEGVSLEKGTRLVVPIYALHRHRQIWESPEIFDPERFSPRAGERPQDDRYAYMPFGAGPRICIGARFAETEALTVLALILRRLVLTPELAATPPGKMEITLRPARPLLMSVTSR